MQPVHVREAGSSSVYNLSLQLREADKQVQEKSKINKIKDAIKTKAEEMKQKLQITKNGKRACSLKRKTQTWQADRRTSHK